MNQMSFGDGEYAAKKKTTRREVFLAEMDQIVPWKTLPQPLREFLAFILHGPRRYGGAGGRPGARG